MPILEKRNAGLLVPLFSLRSGREWGVGEYPDLAQCAEWAAHGGFSLLMTLPLLEPSPGQESPYSSCSFFALDPLYIHLGDVPEFDELGGLTALGHEERELLDRVREAPRVRHADVRRLKEGVLSRCFARFKGAAPAGERVEDYRRFCDENAYWLSDYALFRTLKCIHLESWRDWPMALRDADPEAIAELRRDHATAIEFRTWLQWIAFRQLEAARMRARSFGVALGGDEPFLVADDSADVWAHKYRYRFDATVGAPPDQFSADGQEWGLPPYDWARISQENYSLFEERGRHTARLYDVVRIDHVVGLYRTYHRPRDKSPHYFWPKEEPEQRAQGEAVLRAFGASGTELIAEDLGVIPDFVRASLSSLGIPGYRVLRWEKDYDRFRDPATWPELSIATTGTHDTETACEWWEALSDDERRAALQLPILSRLEPTSAKHCSEEVLDTLLETIYRAPSRLVLVPVQDLLGLQDRINTPNTVGPENWSWRMPWTLPAMAEDAIVRGRQRRAAQLAALTDRASKDR